MTTKTCTHPNCNRPFYAKNSCKYHYYASRKTDDVKLKQQEYQAQYYQDNKERIRDRNLEHRDQRLQYLKEWRLANPDMYRHYRMTNPERFIETSRKQNYAKYGITYEEKLQRIELQGSKCAICGVSEPGGKHGQWVTDHDHATNCLRAELCNSCNLMLGLSKDNPEILKQAAKYLESWSQSKKGAA
jgi:hypothetical protein